MATSAVVTAISKAVRGLPNRPSGSPPCSCSIFRARSEVAATRRGNPPGRGETQVEPRKHPAGGMPPADRKPAAAKLLADVAAPASATVRRSWLTLNRLEECDEGAFLLSRTAGGARSLLGLLDRGVIEVRFSLQAELESIERLMRRYALVPMSLADACLVRMSELYSASTVPTLDRLFYLSTQWSSGNSALRAAQQLTSAVTAYEHRRARTVSF